MGNTLSLTASFEIKLLAEMDQSESGISLTISTNQGARIKTVTCTNKIDPIELKFVR